MRGRRRIVVALVAALAGGLAAVGGGAGAEVSGNISIAGIWTGTEQRSFQAVLDGFKQANPGVNVRYQPGGDNLATILSTAVQGGNPPDLAAVGQPGLIRDFVRQGELKSIAFARPTIARNYSPGSIQVGTVNRQLYGLLFKGANKSTVWYNPTAFRNAGVRPPASFPQFLRNQETLRASGIRPYAVDGASGWELTDLFENIYLRQAGPALYDRLAAHQIPWTHPSVKRALRTFAQVWGNGNLIAGGVSGALQDTFPASVPLVFGARPQAAQILEGDFVAGEILASTKAKPITGFNFYNFPSIGGSPPAVMGGGDTVIMFKDSPAARALIEYLATPQAATIWVKRGGFSSPNRNVAPSAYPDPILRRSAVALATARNFRFDLSDLTPAAFGATDGRGLWRRLQDFLRSPTNVDGIASQIEADADRAYR
jgi:alpha-glucoside transport system substrate-binding protein